MTIEETNASDGVTHAINETGTDESKHEKRKSRAKSVTLKDEVLTRSDSGKLFNVHVHRFLRLGLKYNLFIRKHLQNICSINAGFIFNVFLFLHNFFFSAKIPGCTRM